MIRRHTDTGALQAEFVKKKKGVQQESFDHTWVLSSFLKCVLSGYVPDSQHKWLTWEPDQSVISDLADESDRFPPDRASGLTHWQWSIVQDSTVACSDALMGSAIGPSAVKLSAVLIKFESRFCYFNTYISHIRCFQKHASLFCVQFQNFSGQAFSFFRAWKRTKDFSSF